MADRDPKLLAEIKTAMSEAVAQVLRPSEPDDDPAETIGDIRERIAERVYDAVTERLGTSLRHRERMASAIEKADQLLASTQAGQEKLRALKSSLAAQISYPFVFPAPDRPSFQRYQRPTNLQAVVETSLLIDFIRDGRLWIVRGPADSGIGEVFHLSVDGGFSGEVMFGCGAEVPDRGTTTRVTETGASAIRMCVVCARSIREMITEQDRPLRRPQATDLAVAVPPERLTWLLEEMPDQGYVWFTYDGRSVLHARSEQFSRSGTPDAAACGLAVGDHVVTFQSPHLGSLHADELLNRTTAVLCCRRCYVDWLEGRSGTDDIRIPD